MDAAPNQLSWWRSRLWWAAALAALPVVAVMIAWWGIPRHSIHVWPLLLQAGLIPLLEETVFRGGVQAWLLARTIGQRRFLGISAANGLASALFTSCHLFAHSPLWALAVFPPSLIFGWAFERWRSVTPCWALHGFYNFAYFVVFSA